MCKGVARAYSKARQISSSFSLSPIPFLGAHVRNPAKCLGEHCKLPQRGQVDPGCQTRVVHFDFKREDSFVVFYLKGWS